MFPFLGRGVLLGALLPSALFGASYLIELLVMTLRHPNGFGALSGTDALLFGGTSFVIFSLTFFHALLGETIGLLLAFGLRKFFHQNVNPFMIFLFGALYGSFITWYLAGGFFGENLAVVLGALLGLSTAYVFLRQSDYRHKSHRNKNKDNKNQEKIFKQAL